MGPTWNSVIQRNVGQFRPLLLILVLAGVAGCAGQFLNRADNGTDAAELQYLAEQAYAARDWAGSERYYALLIKQAPGDAISWYRLGNVYAWTQRPDAAVQAYGEAVSRDPELSKAWFNLGLVQLKQAAGSFNELQKFADMEDPLYLEGRKIFTGILELIKGDNNQGD